MGPSTYVGIHLDRGVTYTGPGEGTGEQVATTVYYIVYFTITTNAVTFCPNERGPRDNDSTSSSMVGNTRGDFILYISTTRSRRAVRVNASGAILPSCHLSCSGFNSLRVGTSGSFSIDNRGVGSIGFSYSGNDFSCASLGLVGCLGGDDGCCSVVIPCNNRCRTTKNDEDTLLGAVLTRVRGNSCSSCFGTTSVRGGSTKSCCATRLICSRRSGPINMNVLTRRACGGYINFGRGFTRFRGVGGRGRGVVRALI